METSTVSSPVKRVRLKSSRNRWVAINNQNKIISEGLTADSVRKKALKLSDQFIITFVPKEGASYVL